MSRRLPSIVRVRPSPVRSGVLTLLLAFAACGGEAEDDAAGDAPAGVAAAPGDVPDPCEVLDDDLLATRFDLSGAEVTRTPSQYSPQPLCTVSWQDPASGDRREVTLTFYDGVADDTDQAVAWFEAAMRTLEQGTTREIDGEEVTMFQYEVEPVTGVGDRAAWVGGLSQLSVVWGGIFFHVGVDVADDGSADREHALALAREIGSAFE